MNISVDKNDFKMLLSGLGEIHDSCVLNLSDDGIHGIASSDDNSMYAHAHLEGYYSKIDLNIPSLRKLSKALDMISVERVNFKINVNHLEYKDSQIKFKYHLHESGVITRPNLSLDKIRNFEYGVTFDLNFDFLSNLIQKSSITNTKKLYISTENGHMVWKIGDESTPNSDSISVIGEEVDFEMPPFILMIDNLKLLYKASNNGNLFKVNTKLGVGSIITKSGDFMMEYIFSSLKN